MKICPNCNKQYDDTANVCATCGIQLASVVYNPQQQSPYQQPIYQPNVAFAVDLNDHTAEFEADDIAKNKIFAILLYCASFLGIIVALLAAKDSKFVMFHLKEYLKLFVLEAIVAAITVALFFTIIVPLVCGVAMVALGVVNVIGFVYACQGKAKTLPIVRWFGFLK